MRVNGSAITPPNKENDIIEKKELEAMEQNSPAAHAPQNKVNEMMVSGSAISSPSKENEIMEKKELEAMEQEKDKPSI